MSDLTLTEQKHVRTALRYLRRRTGAWAPVADSLGFKADTVRKAAYGMCAISASMAFRVARLVEVSVDDLVAGRFLSGVGVCPRCGYVPDFSDESTVVENEPRPAPGGGLKIVK